MSEEYKISDVRGRFMQPVKEGRRLNDPSWTNGRIVLSNKRLVLAGNGGKRTVPLSKVEGLGGRHDASQAVARVSGYTSLPFDGGENVVLVATEDHDTLEGDLYRAFLDQEVVYAKHPAVAGGVVQDSVWEQARVKVGDDSLDVATKSGAFVQLDLDDIGGISTGERTVEGEMRGVIEAEHTEGETSVQTHLSGTERQCRFLAAYLQKGAERSKANVDLDESDREVLMALYSGVSPFEIPNFLGMDTDRVESIFERLIELDVLEEVRVRREVSLKPRGRNIASEAMNDQ
ncbi:CheF family chemotaxis protein [Halobium salinum]|uniref:Taxis protein CheF n=1 Tax=Halobium salinum TaxID=1364940 RepID=A0ABD5P8M4_9EURY|nr:CheF family chemotaxis protein [Halobium salinum]